MPWAVVVAQLVEWSLPTPEVHGSNAVIGKISIEHLFTVNNDWKDEIKKKEARNNPLKKTLMSANGCGHLTEGDEVENLLNAPKQWSQFDIKTTFVLWLGQCEPTYIYYKNGPTK